MSCRLARGQSIDPGGGPVDRLPPGLRGGPPGRLPHLQGVVTVVDHDDFVWGCQACPDPFQRLEGAERVACSLDEEHGSHDLLEVLVAKPVGPARWVKGVTEEEKPIRSDPAGCDVRGDPSAHRFPAEDQPPAFAFTGKFLDNRTVGVFQHRLTIGASPTLLGVGEVEPAYPRAQATQPLSDKVHELVSYPGARAGSEDHERWGRRRTVEQTRNPAMRRCKLDGLRRAQINSSPPAGRERFYVVRPLRSHRTSARGELS